MKRTVLFLSLLSLTLATSSLAQSGQSPAIQQSTSTTDTRQANPPKPKLKKSDRGRQNRMETGMDSTLPKNRKQRRLNPDSLRRGGATRVDTVR